MSSELIAALVGAAATLLVAALTIGGQELRARSETRRETVDRQQRSQGMMRIVAAELYLAHTRLRTEAHKPDDDSRVLLPMGDWERYGPDIAGALPLAVVDKLVTAYSAVALFNLPKTTAADAAVLLQHSDVPEVAEALEQNLDAYRELRHSAMRAVAGGFNALRPFLRDDASEPLEIS